MEQICPACGKDQGVPSTDCRKCGIVFAKYERGPSLRPVDEPDSFERYHAPEEKKKRSCLGTLLKLALAAVLLLVLGVGLVFNRVKSSESYAVASALATSHPIVLTAVGAEHSSQVDIASVFVFHIELNPGGAGSAVFALPVEGPTSQGVTVVELRRSGDVWTVSDAMFAGATGVEAMLVQDGVIVGVAPPTTAPVSTTPDGRPGLTADQLLKADVETWGTQTTPEEPTPP